MKFKFPKLMENAYSILLLVVIVIQFFVTVFPQLGSFLPEGWQNLAVLIIIWFIFNNTTKISDELKTKTSVVDISEQMKDILNKINQMCSKESGSLLMPGHTWDRGAELIDELEKGDIIFASNLVSWKTDLVKNYISANITALKKGVKIKRLYADNENNRALAEEQAKWVENDTDKEKFERKMYKTDHQMLDYILATDSNAKPKWAVLWLYTPEEENPFHLHGLHIVDKNILHGLKKDFDVKWNTN